MTGRGFFVATVLVMVASAVGMRPAWSGVSANRTLSIEAKLDTDRVAPGEPATLTVQVRCEGLSLPEVPLPPLQGVTVERGGTAQNFSMMNGRVERTSTTVYRLIPRVEGVVRIPPLRIAVAGERAESSPLTLTVSHAASSRHPSPMRGLQQPGNVPQGTPELFVKATVDHSSAVLNEQIVLRLRLYSRVDVLGDVDWKPPSTSGFWTEGLGPPRQGRVTLNGVEYAMMEIPTALFPTKTGTLTIGAGRMRCRIARVVPPPDPWSMLALPDIVPQEVSLLSDPITITVDPLPPGAPVGFQGAVGTFTFSFRVDGLTARAGEPLAARATIGGTGNVATIRDPEIHARGAARQYVAGSSTRLDRSGDRLVGERQTDVAFVADQPGSIEILPVKFAWYDPEAKRYRSQTSDSVRVRVLPGTVSESNARRAMRGDEAIAAPRRTPGPFGSLALDPPFGSTAILGLSVLAYGAAILTGRARQRMSGDPRFARIRSLEALLARDLARADSLAREGQPAKAAALAEQALRRGAGLRYDADVAGLARVEWAREIKSRGADDAEVTRLQALFDSLAAIAYAPPETRSADAREAIRAVAGTLERYRAEMAL
ncbi:MAG TPA: BatD family protein [Candidatus Limnocylindrales bacterium]|nr:BatD family protein [Candidatus Limnocylindrales bacterium]